MLRKSFSVALAILILTHCTDQTDLEICDAPASASGMLELKAYTIMPTCLLPFYYCFETGSHYIAKADSELMYLQSQPPKCWVSTLTWLLLVILIIHCMRKYVEPSVRSFHVCSWQMCTAVLKPCGLGLFVFYSKNSVVFHN